MRKILGLAPMLLVSTLAVAQDPTSSSPWTGNWTMNVSQSKLHPPGMKEETVTIQPPGGDSLTVRYEVTGTDGSGKGFSTAVDAKADGQAYPVMSDGNEIATVTWHRQSPYQYVSDETITGGITITTTHVLAHNGKRFTSHSHVTGPNGTYDETVVWDKAS